jgi:hypothetical protein
MKYQCGHRACDLCGRERQCEQGSARLKSIGHFELCSPCVTRAVRLTVGLAQQLGGIVIDITSPCQGRNIAVAERAGEQKTTETLEV